MNNTNERTINSLRSVAKMSLKLSFFLFIALIISVIANVVMAVTLNKAMEKIETIEMTIEATKAPDEVATHSDAVAEELQPKEQKDYLKLDHSLLSFSYKSIDEINQIIKNKESVLPETNDVDYGILSTNEIHKESFSSTVAKVSPNLVGIEDAILKNYETYGINPSFQLAVFCLESGYGKSSLAVNKNNLCGHHAFPTETLTAYQNATSFDTKSDCVLAFGKNINDTYISNNLVTVSSISKRYCPPNSSNWATNVTNLTDKITKIYEEYIGGI